jgi:hypothetical protein
LNSWRVDGLPGRLQPKAFEGASPARRDGGVDVAAAGLEHAVAALQLGVFMYAVAGMGQLVAEVRAGQRCILGIEEDRGVLVGQ